MVLSPQDLQRAHRLRARLLEQVLKRLRRLALRPGVALWP